MRYGHILAAVAGELWAIQEEKLEAITAFLSDASLGVELSAEDIQARTARTREREDAPAPKAIGVINIHGVISKRMNMMSEISGGTSIEQADKAFDAMLGDDCIQAILFDHDSPGGGVYGVEEFATKIRESRGIKPIISQINSLSASASYYLASQADEVIASPGSDGGSIGVYQLHMDTSGKLEKEGFKPTIIRSTLSPHKAEMTGLEPLAEEGRKATLARVDEAMDAFVENVAAGRAVTRKKVLSDFGKGRVMSAKQMLEAGMVDRIQPLSATLAKLGVPGPKVGSSALSRQAFASGASPSLALVEDVLREAGFPKALALDFVSVGKRAMDRSESGQETANPERQQAFAELRKRLQARA